MSGTTTLYVYGVVPKATPAELFADVPGVDPSAPVVLVGDGDVAAIASGVPLHEFGEDTIESNLRDPAWLEQKVRAHDRVLDAAVGRTTVLPFRFGAIYSGEEQVRKMLLERPDFADLLSRLDGAVELGVKGYLDPAAFRQRLAAGRSGDEDAAGGRAYMQRKQQEREQDVAASSFAADCAQESHERLGAAANAARANPLQRPEAVGPDRVMVLNAAYLVRADEIDGFRAELTALERAFGANGVSYELTGPWPPYNFAQDDEP